MQTYRSDRKAKQAKAGGIQPPLPTFVEQKLVLFLLFYCAGLTNFIYQLSVDVSQVLMPIMRTIE